MEKAPGLTSLRAIRGRRGVNRARQILSRELAAGREHPERWRERLGETDKSRPPGPLIWIQTPSEEAGLDFPQLMNRMHLERDELNFLVTTARYDPSSPLHDHLPAGCVHQYLPYEDGPGMTSFLEHWRPDICIWSDNNIPAAVIDKIFACKVPLYYLEASMPDEKMHKLRWFPGAIRKTLNQFEHILAVDGRSARNLKQLGAKADKIEVMGYLHEGAPPLDCAQSERDELARLLAARPVWLAAGITREEEAPVLATHKTVSRRSHRLLLILVPQEEKRGPDLARELEHDGWIVALRSANQEPEPETQIYIADLEGEMGLWFRLSPVCFIGGSLAGSSGPGRDPYQATALGSAILHGPKHGAFTKNYARLHAAGAACQIDGETAFSRELEYLLAPDKVAEMARAAWEVSTSGAEVSDRISELVLTAIDTRSV